MGQFIVRRLMGMILVLFAISIIVFLIFNVIPNSDPAQRMAGKNATPALVESINKDWGFNDPLPAAVPDDDEEDLLRRTDLLQQPAQRQRTDLQGPAGHVLTQHRRRSDLDVLRGDLRLPLGGQGRRRDRPPADRGRDRRHLDAGVRPRRRLPQVPRLRHRDIPVGRLRQADRRTDRMGLPPDPSLDDAGDHLRRLLQPRPALQHARRDGRRLRPHRAGKGADRAHR